MSDLMQKIEVLWGLPIFYKKAEDASVKSFGIYPEAESPFVCCPRLVDLLIAKSSSRQVPVIYKDENKLYFVCIRSGSGFYFTGPVSSETMSYVEIHRFYKTYGISASQEKHPLRISLGKILTFVSFIYELLEDISVDEDTLMEENNLVEKTRDMKEKENTIMEMKKIEEEVAHHTYQEERYVMDCIRDGDTEHILERMEVLLESAGILSSKQFNSQRNLAIVSVTIATREAMAGGVSPSEAYRISDVFINQIDRCTRIEQLVEYMRKAAFEFTKRVSEVRKERALSNYTEQCKDYISKNYHHKLYVEDIAEAIGVSEGYLSRIFRENMGLSIQEYIQKIRVERAANLLKYSEATLSQISDYVCFHSQSHFGSVFKKYMHMTPKQYREQYKQKEFISEKQSGPV